jgi:hypothetical protein
MWIYIWNILCTLTLIITLPLAGVGGIEVYNEIRIGLLIRPLLLTEKDIEGLIRNKAIDVRVADIKTPTPSFQGRR